MMRFSQVYIVLKTFIWFFVEKYKHHAKYIHYVKSSKKYLLYLDDNGRIVMDILTCKEFLNYYKKIESPDTRKLFEIRNSEQFLEHFHPLYGLYGLRTSDSGFSSYCYFIGENMEMVENYIDQFDHILNNTLAIIHMDEQERKIAITRIRTFLLKKNRENKINEILT